MTPQAGGTEPEWGTAAASLDLPVEAAGVADRLSTADRFYALRRARRLGVGVDEVLLAAGHASADALAGGAARELGVPFEPLDAACAIAPAPGQHRRAAEIRPDALRRRVRRPGGARA